MPAQITVKDLQIDLSTQRVLRGSGEVPLTPQEFALLVALLDHRGRPLSRCRLLQLAWGWTDWASEAETRTVDVHIQHLRKKLGLGREIQTVYKIGYQFS